jgi:hypothetical protein
MKAYGEWTSALGAGEWSASRPGHFTAGVKALATHWIGGWVNPREGLDDVKKGKFLTPPGLELRPLCCPARSQSLYRLCFPGSYWPSYIHQERETGELLVLEGEVVPTNLKI